MTILPGDNYQNNLMNNELIEVYKRFLLQKQALYYSLKGEIKKLNEKKMNIFELQFIFLKR